MRAPGLLQPQAGPGAPEPTLKRPPYPERGHSLAGPRVPRGEGPLLLPSPTHSGLPLCLCLQTGGQATETQKLLVGTIFLNTFFPSKAYSPFLDL